MTLIACPDPECGATAEIDGQYPASSTAGPLAHVRTRCVRRHVFVLPAELVGVPVELTPYPVSRVQDANVQLLENAGEG